VRQCERRAEKHYQRRNAPEVLAAMRELADACDAVEWLPSCLGALTAEDVRAALSALPLQERSWVFAALRWNFQPREVKPALGQRVLDRIGAAQAGPAVDALHALTGAVWRDIVSAAYPEDHDQVVDAYKTVRPVSVWSQGILRAALWFAQLSSPGQARLWLWAAKEPWLVPPGISADAVTAVLDAARALVAATPDFHPFPDRRPKAAVITDSAPDSTPGDHDDAPVIVADLTGQRPTETDSVPTEVLEQERGNDAGDVRNSLAAAAASLRTVEAAFDNARNALVTAAGALDNGLPIAEIDLVALRATGVVFAAARTALIQEARRHPELAETATSTLDDLKRVLAEMSSLADNTGRRTGLERVTALLYTGTSETIAHALAELQSRAGALLSHGMPAADDQVLQGLLALDDLVTLSVQAGGGGDPEAAFALQQRVQTAFPPQVLVATAAMMGQLRLPDAEDIAAADIPAQEPPLVTPQLEEVVSTAVSAQNVPTSANEATHQPSADSEVPQVLAPTQPEPSAGSGPAANGAGGGRRTRRPELAGDANRTIPTTLRHPAGDPTVAGIAGLIGTRRFDAAAAVTTAADYPPQLTLALTIAAVADRSRDASGGCAARLGPLFAAVDPAAAKGDQLTRLILTPALLRVALVNGDPTAGTLLQAIEDSIEPGVARLCAEVAGRAVKNVFVSGALRSVHVDLAELTGRIDAAGVRARTMLARKPTLRGHRRATDIAGLWLTRDGLLGTMLNAVAGDHRDQAAHITVTLDRLTNIDAVRQHARAAEGGGRRSRKPLDDTAIAELSAMVAELTEPVTTWTQAVLALTRRQSNDSHTRWVAGELTTLRGIVTSRRDTVSATLTALAHDNDDHLIAAAARAARDSLDTSAEFLLTGRCLDDAEPPAPFVAELELLRISIVRFSAHQSPALGGHPSAATLLTGFAATWEEAFRTHLEHENYTAALAIHTMAADSVVDVDPAAVPAAAVTAAAERSRGAIAGIYDELSAQLRLARRQNELDEDQDSDLAGRIRAANPSDPPDRLDLDVVRSDLADISQVLPSYRDQAVTRLHERLARIDSADPREVATITALLANGELGIAEEQIYFLEAGEPFPEDRSRNDFSVFFPAVPDALPQGLVKKLLNTVNGGHCFNDIAGLDFAGLSQDTRATTSAALRNWMTVRDTAVEGRLAIDERALLVPVLRLLGYDASRAERRSDLARSSERRFVDFHNVGTNGHAMVPAFGSLLDRRLRVLLVWGRPSEEKLLSWAQHDTSRGSLMVFYFGTLTSDARRRLATRAVSSAVPIIVIDDAALAYLAAHGEGQLDATMSITLPFAAVNPYVNVRKGVVATEMFYGRTDERRKVLDPQDTSVLYGGRGLGKSALLRASAEQFELEAGHVAVYLDLNEVGFAAGQKPDAIWDGLLTVLVRREIIASRTTKVAARTRAYERVRDGITRWLADQPHRRLLILLDESDSFFETDAPSFQETNRLKILSQTGEGSRSRVKVVFAGLHTVQRFAHANTNGPFSHLGRPTVIGSLKPQGAFDLLARPLAALGYTWDAVDLINRALAFTSYQPFLLQMLGYRLVGLLHAERGKAGLTASEPPYRITRRHIEAVEADAQLSADIHLAFTDTLRLDPRYGVIAYVIAHHAYENGTDARLSDLDLRAECQYYWPAGFADLPTEHFRAYLKEMVGLGVLAPKDTRGWRLRSPNALRMIGSHNDVMDNLITAAETSLPDEFVALETRPLVKDIRSPLTARQITDVLGERTNQVRIVVGSDATGIDDTVTAIESTCKGLGTRFELQKPRNKGEYRAALTDGRPGQRRVVVSDLRGVSGNAADDSLEWAIDMTPTTPGVTRSVVLIVGPSEMSWWTRHLAAGGGEEVGVVTLQRHTPRTLMAWARTGDAFSNSGRTDELFTLTGGWPVLVERAAHLARHHNESRALKTLREELESDTAARHLVRAIGISEGTVLYDVFGPLSELLESWVGESEIDDVLAATEHPDAGVAWAALRALEAFDTDGIAGDRRYRINPLLGQMWHRL
jgi:hypothetical protein